MNDAFGKKLQQKLHPVYLTLIKMGASKEDAEDITQDTVIQFLQYIDGIDIDFAQAWLYRVAINKYYDSLKKKKSHDQYILAFDMNQLFEFDTPEQLLLRSELQQDIQQVLRQLKPKEAELLIMKYSANFSLKDIALLYHTSDKTIKTQLARAKQKMVKLLEEGRENEG
ncbi:RNA polymerase sigma factor [Cytobacillus purgationiresistens]|uniref:RNA polymerase sigma-70 factor (ECF subfamily) n=1 Tax=Cytobacillus purgationiresistens TaxID=863449 RepID=A0ABU0AKA2_9BACI|nr:sigma-70 family RNA polymerase sigma factor [Cytobacillus purgationiresistens]MDQ0271690.1 RNA polymerase sigma-70 factor (ECF subfamily) [Cytobacillus purgationiresistens]